MDLSVFLLTLITCQVIHCAPLKENQSVFKELVSKCTNLSNNKMVKECSKEPIAEITDITETNEKSVLCTIFLHNMLIFSDKVNSCSESLLFPNPESYKSLICENPDFLVETQTNIHYNSSVICIKLCINWDETVNSKCSLAHYYYNTSSSHIDLKEDNTDISHLKQEQNIQNKNPKENNSNTASHQIAIVPTNVENNNPSGDPVDTIKTSSSIKNTGKPNPEMQHEVNENSDKKNHIGKQIEDNTHQIRKDDKQEIGEIIPPEQQNNTDSSKKKAQIKEVGVIVNQPKQQVKIDNVIKTTQKNIELVRNEDDIQDSLNILGDEDENTYDNQQQEPNRSDLSKMEKPNTLVEDRPVSNNNADVDGESYFFSYFMVVCIFFVMGYVFYHNRTKVMGLVIEGKRNKRQFRNRRPNSANYHKLDSNLEEALTSSCNKNSNQIIY